MSVQKHVWIVNYYTTPPEFVSNERHLKFAHYLQEAGYKVTIFSASFLGGNVGDLIEDNSDFKFVDYGEYHFCHIKVRPYKGNGLNRIYSIWQFARRLLKYRNKFAKPDIILHNIHPPFDTAVSLCAKKLKARYIAEAWDVWPDDFVVDGLISAWNPAMIWAYAQTRKIYNRATDVVFSFAGGLDYLKHHRWTESTGGKIKDDKVHYINTGVSLEEFDQNKINNVLDDVDLLNQDLFKIIYLGSIQSGNDVKQLIEGVALLRDFKNIRLFVFGDGSQREELIEYCKKHNIDNVVFKNKRIPLSKVPFVVSCANLNIMNYIKGFGRYGVSSGKMFQYLAAGKPIVCNVPIAYDNVITDNNLGCSADLSYPQNYADEILKIYNMDSNTYHEMCRRVRKVAERFDYKILSQHLISVLENE